MVDPKQRSVTEALGELDFEEVRPSEDKWFIFRLGRDEVVAFPDPENPGQMTKVFYSPEHARSALGTENPHEYDILGPVRFAAGLDDTSQMSWWHSGGRSHLQAIKFGNWEGRQPVSVEFADGSSVRDSEAAGADFEFHVFMGRLDPAPRSKTVDETSDERREPAEPPVPVGV